MLHLIDKHRVKLLDYLIFRSITNKIDWYFKYYPTLVDYLKKKRPILSTSHEILFFYTCKASFMYLFGIISYYDIVKPSVPVNPSFRFVL